MAEDAMKSRWRWRVFTTFLLLFSFLSLAATGVVCYIKPRGAIAHWTGWTFLGLRREDWYGAHMALSVLFLAAAGLHVLFNWGALSGYFRKAFRFRGPGLKEGAFSLLLVFAFWAGTLARVPPVSWIPRGYAYMEKEAWAGRGASRPPWDGAERTGLRELSLVFGLSYPEFREKLRAAGFSPRSPEESLESLAERYGLSPAGVILRSLGDKEGMSPSRILVLLREGRSGK